MSSFDTRAPAGAKSYVHAVKGPTFETTSSPWFGPRARARELLEQADGPPVPPVAALEAMRTVLGGAFSDIQHVRFVDFADRKRRFHYRIAVLWIKSKPASRQTVYDRAAAVVAASGWYPLPQGERMGSAHQVRAVPRRMAVLPDLGQARLVAVSSAVSHEGGCALRISLSTGASILLDAGLPGCITPVATDSLVLISHSHRDHLGGVESGRLAGLPVVLSPATAFMLTRTERLAAIEACNPVRTLRPGDVVDLGSYLRLSCIAVPHLPGSVGFVLQDDQRSIIYTGDVSLTSDRHDFLPALLAAAEHTGVATTVLLDCTMAGRAAGASLAPTTAAADVLRERDLLVLADSAEYLLYAYLDLFHQVQQGPLRHTVSFEVTPRLRPLFVALHDAFIRRELDSVDPFLAGQYGDGMSSWAESRWLYWGATAGADARRCVLLTQNEWRPHLLSSQTPTVAVGRRPVPEQCQSLDLDTTPWTLHSGRAALSRGVSELAKAGADVLGFHNFPRRIAKFASVEGVALRPVSGQVLLN